MTDLKENKFRNMSHEERLEYIKKKAKIDDKEILLFKDDAILKFEDINKMIENAIGTFQIPLELQTIL